MNKNQCGKLKKFQDFCPRDISLRSWRDFARESFCFGSEAVKESGGAVGGLVKSPVVEESSCW